MRAEEIKFCQMITASCPPPASNADRLTGISITKQLVYSFAPDRSIQSAAIYRVLVVAIEERLLNRFWLIFINCHAHTYALRIT